MPLLLSPASLPMVCKFFLDISRLVLLILLRICASVFMRDVGLSFPFAWTVLWFGDQGNADLIDCVGKCALCLPPGSGKNYKGVVTADATQDGGPCVGPGTPRWVREHHRPLEGGDLKGGCSEGHRRSFLQSRQDRPDAQSTGGLWQPLQTAAGTIALPLPPQAPSAIRARPPSWHDGGRTLSSEAALCPPTPAPSS